MAGANAEQNRRSHLLVVGGTGAGHFYPFRQILYLLSAPQYVSKIIVTVVDINSRLAEVAELKARGDFGSLDLRFEELPIPAMGNKSGKHSGRKLGNARTVRLKERAFKSLKNKLLLEKDNADALTCILSDMFYTFLVELAEELKVSWYPLVPSATWYTYSCFLSSNPLVRSTDPEVRKQNIPGLEFARVFDYPPDILDNPEFYTTKCERFERSKAILISDVEAWDAPVGVLTALRDYLKSKEAASQKKQMPRVLQIGPMANITGFTLSPPAKYEDLQKPECLTWLDKQPASSVLYIAFGTELNLTHKGILELAHGLENSGLSFLWVLKIRASETLESVLPAGFQDRSERQRFIEIGFAPQSRILQHPSVGGFMSHCGWNSCMESICAGVPLITWPLARDQLLNARFLVNVWKAAVGIKNPNEDYRSGVSKEEVTKAVEALMIGEGGKEVRKNVQKLKSLAETALKEGGTSYTALHSFATEITNTVPPICPNMNLDHCPHLRSPCKTR